jgi:pyruvate dehydrogenase E2 component (dihydrolipoamide acetyltransferase)
MMALKVIMPKQGLQMTEGQILAWLVPEGGPVKKGQPLFEIETDKVTITIDSPADGTLLKVIRGVGETVPVAETVAIIGEPGESTHGAAETGDTTGVSAPAPAPASAPVTALDPAPETRKIEAAAIGGAQSTRRGRMKSATPRASMRAAELGIDADSLIGSGPDGLVIERDVLAQKDQKGGARHAVGATPLAKRVASLNHIEIGKVKGSGPSGRVVKNDILRALSDGEGSWKETGSTASHLGREAVFIPHKSIRKAIAKRMVESLRTSAQANHTISIDCSELLRLRRHRKAAGEELSLTDIFVKIAATALERCPYMNSAYTEEGIYVLTSVNIGVAVALEDGLVVPVLKNVESLSLVDLGAKLRELVSKAKAGSLSMEDVGGSTFTITNLGMLEIDSFTAIIQQPENAILALGVVRERPVVSEGAIVARPTMNATLTYDHRAVDGAPAAKFLKTFRDICENPYLLV